ncbi:MAG: class I SAM-dependent methyltransferase [Nitrospiraceae bacterium]
MTANTVGTKEQAVADDSEASSVLKDRYRDCYNRIAGDDLIEPLESGKDARNLPLLNLIGDVKGKRVLDVGSAQGLLLDHMRTARTTVCTDLAAAYLRVARGKAHCAVQAEGECLPFHIGTFDVVVCTGVLEHVLDPTAVMREVKRVLSPNGRFYVLVPWEEDLSKYTGMETSYEFTHLRSFDDDLVGKLFEDFEIVRRRGVEPNVEHPPHQKILNALPLHVSQWLSRINRQVWVVLDYAEGRWHWKLPRRIQYGYWRWYWKQLAQLPKRDWFWLWFYPPFHMIFELRPLGAAGDFNEHS